MVHGKSFHNVYHRIPNNHSVRILPDMIQKWMDENVPLAAGIFLLEGDFLQPNRIVSFGHMTILDGLKVRFDIFPLSKTSLRFSDKSA